MYITEDVLLAAGYRKFGKWPPKIADNLFQRRISDENGTRYYIDIWMYDWSKYPHHIGEYKQAFEAEAYYSDGISAILHHCEERTLEKVEEFFADLFIKFGAGYYEMAGGVDA